MSVDYEKWDAVIGLEIHAQLNTQTKLFSPAPNQFSEQPNTNVHPIDLGLPGTLPLLNEAAVEKAVRLGVGLNATIHERSSFDRKSYFYPDNPRNFQITQFYQPILSKGVVQFTFEGKQHKVHIKEAHLEDDTGMLKHFGQFAGVDYNRSGSPLIEIVSMPEIHTPAIAVAYAQHIQLLLIYLDISTGNMEEGALRMDVNVSVRPKDSDVLRPKVEIKNMNSFHNMSTAITAEIERQIKAYSGTESTNYKQVIHAGTYRFDVAKKMTIVMREKENAEDYRYFPEPDLPPLVISSEYIKAIREGMPEMPEQRLARYVTELQIPSDLAQTLVNEKPLSDFFEAALAHTSHATLLVKWIAGELLGRLKVQNLSVNQIFPPKRLADLINLMGSGQITMRQGKTLLDRLVGEPSFDCVKEVQTNPQYEVVRDPLVLEPLIKKIVEENPQSIELYKSGRTKAKEFLIGQVMKQTSGKAHPEVVSVILQKYLNQ